MLSTIKSAIVATMEIALFGAVALYLYAHGDALMMIGRGLQ